MTLEVIGAGFGRTGTMSLKVALETLGFGPCYHMIEVFEHPEHVGFWEAAWRSEPVDCDKVLGGYEATVDWPACTFDGKFEDKHHAIEVFNRHNEEVRRRVPRERLLVYEVREGWGPLCEFLGVEEPDQPFPRLNDAAQMRRRILAVRFLSAAVPAALALLGIGALALFRRSARA